MRDQIDNFLAEIRGRSARHSKAAPSSMPTRKVALAVRAPAHATGSSIDAEVVDDFGIGKDLFGLEAFLVDEDGDKVGPDEFRGPGTWIAWWSGSRLRKKRSAQPVAKAGSVPGAIPV